mmetsp:Transcript_95541/g.208898  ORF Transcript_95541/g.208898 Transcript_95541/m.208898 type:complete len:369 (+) Transcript_95541:116-1222(+)
MSAAGKSLVAGLVALAAATAVKGDAAVPSCAVRDEGYEDPAVPRVNGGIEVQDAQSCQNLCKGLIGCQVFTYYINSGGCWLQGLSGTLPSPKAIQGVWSGPAHCSSDAAAAAAAVPDLSSATVDPEPDAGSQLAAATATPAAEVITVPPTKEGNSTKDIFTALPDGPSMDPSNSAAAGATASSSERAIHDGKTSSNGDVPLPLKVFFTALLAIACLLAAYACCHKKKAEKNPYRRKRGVELDVEEGSPNSARSPGSPGSEASWVHSGSPTSPAGEIVDDVVEEPAHPGAAPLAPQGLLSGAPPMMPMMYHQQQHQQQPFMYPGLHQPQPASFVAPYSGMSMAPQQRHSVMEPTQVQRPVVQEPLQRGA